MRLVAMANCGAADRSIGSDSARAAAPGSLAGLPRFSDHADVHRCQRPALWGRRRSGWAAAHSCPNQCPGCGARPRLGFAARGRCGPSPSALQGQIYLGQNVSEHDVAPASSSACAQAVALRGALPQLVATSLPLAACRPHTSSQLTIPGPTIGRVARVVLLS